MVKLKVTDGRTIRKFCLQLGEDGFQQLKQKLAAFFPQSVKENQEMQLSYRDSEGDLITVTTDSEFQEALKELPPQSEWKIHIHSQHDKARQTPSINPTFPRSRFTDARQAMRASQSNPWFRPLLPFSRSHPTLWDFPSWPDELDDFISWSDELDDFIHNTSLLDNAVKKSNDAQKEHSSQGNASESSTQQNNAETAKNKTESNEKDAAKEGNSMSEVHESALSSVPGLKVHRFGSWKPRHYQGVYSSGTVVGPVGYYASWGYEENGEKNKTSTEEGGDKQREVDKNEEEMARSEAQVD